MGDWNAIVGEGKEDKNIGHYGLGWRNDRGEKLVEFCKRRKLYVANTWRRRYTWKSPGDRGRFQIDYILIKNRFGPGADIFSDHILVVAKINIKLKKLHRTCHRQSWNMDKLKNDDFVAMEYRCNVNSIRGRQQG